MTRSKPARLRQRAARRDALLGAYVAPEVVAHIVSDGRTPLLSGVRLRVTVLFADIRGFTRLADTLPAERVVTMLDEFFDAMSAPALAHRAMIDKLIGDAIMLVYGVPSAEGDEEWRALTTASAMHGAFALLRARWKPTLPPTLRPGLAIGCASGEAVLANVGSPARMDYTLVGRPVNLAARLTAAAGAGETLVSATVRDAALAARHMHVRFGRARHLVLKGMRGRVTAYPTWIVAKRPTARTAPTTATDPVCGMKVGAGRGLVLVYRGRAYHFCSPTCRAAFRRGPRRYVEHSGSPTGDTAPRGRRT
ncbi:MAG TPA: adenylate/guanylate cyclase domain-containing protein [Candidatus Dormibacteraeota bacterium]|nr:adenylate/guanylate cyclase domain-containing protein [Candidatus Dormibacteraeota bacterium]